MRIVFDDGDGKQAGRASKVRDGLLRNAEKADDIDHAGDKRQQPGADPDPARERRHPPLPTSRWKR